MPKRNVKKPVAHVSRTLAKDYASTSKEVLAEVGMHNHTPYMNRAEIRVHVYLYSSGPQKFENTFKTAGVSHLQLNWILD